MRIRYMVLAKFPNSFRRNPTVTEFPLTVSWVTAKDVSVNNPHLPLETTRIAQKCER
ncbi:hypothetical protein HDA40_005846 [Hamadaea flava]|nr:hypothetical protein [Hamadaea flava]